MQNLINTHENHQEITCLQIVKMYGAIKSYKADLSSGRTRQGVQTRFNSLRHSLHNICG